VVDREQHAIGRAGVDDSIAVSQVESHWLLAEDRLGAVAHRRLDDVGMRAGVRGDADDIRPLGA
jgi:hypothetical protein